MSSTEEAPTENFLQKAGQAVIGVVDKTGEVIRDAVDKTGEVLRKPLKTSDETPMPMDVDDQNKTSTTMASESADRRSTVRRRSIFLSAVNPNSHVQLRLDEDLFKNTPTGEDIPIASIVSGTPFYNLQIRGKLFDSNEVVLEDGTNDSVVALVERKYTTVGYTFQLYSKRPSTPNQEPSNIMKYNTKLYDFAKVNEKDGVLHVVKEGETEVKYTLETKGEKYVIKKLGTTVATMSPSEGEFYQLDLDEGVDPCLLICLAAIADELKKKNY